MFLSQAPLGRFVLGSTDPHVRSVPKIPPLSIPELVARGAASLSRAVVLKNGKEVASLPIISGNITIDATNEPTRILQAEVAGLAEWVPNSEQHMLHPLARTEVRVDVGIVRPRQETVWEPMGVFTVTSTDAEENADGLSVSIHCPDRIPRIRRTVMRASVEVSRWFGEKQAALEDIVAAIFADSCGDWITVRAFRTGIIIPIGVYGHPGADPWETAQNLVKAHGMKLVLNRAGEAELRRVQDISTQAPEAIWQTGNASGLASIRRSTDVTEYATGVIVPRMELTYGQVVRYNPDKDWEPYMATVVISSKPVWSFVPDKAQKEYIILDDVDASTITSEWQAQDAGKAKLVELGKNVETVSGTAIFNPYLDADSVVQIDDPKLGLRMLTRLQKMTVTLNENVMGFELGDKEVKVA